MFFHYSFFLEYRVPKKNINRNKKEKLVNIIESLLFNGNLLIIFIYTDEFSIHLISFSSL